MVYSAVEVFFHLAVLSEKDLCLLLNSKILIEESKKEKI